MKTITTSEVSRGKHKLKFELEHSAVNKDTTNLSDALKHTAPTMLPMSTFNRVTGTMAAKESSGDTFLTHYDEPDLNLADKFKTLRRNLTKRTKAIRKAAPMLGTANYRQQWRANYNKLMQPQMGLGGKLLKQQAGVEPYAGRTGETALGVGSWLGRAMHGLSNPNAQGRNLGISAALGAAGGYGVGKLTGSDHPLIYSILGSGLAAYLNNKSMQATGNGTPWFNTTGETRAQLLEGITKKTSSGVLSGDVHGALTRLIAHEASLDENTRTDLLRAVRNKPEWELLSLLRQVSGGLVGGGLVAFLASKLLGRRAAVPGAVLGYLLGNLMGGKNDTQQDLNGYGRRY